jgi:hypothetical protein
MLSSQSGREQDAGRKMCWDAAARSVGRKNQGINAYLTLLSKGKIIQIFISSGDPMRVKVDL